MTGTNTPEPTLTEGQTEEEFFQSIQDTLRKGSDTDLAKAMEQPLSAPKAEEIVQEVPIVASDEPVVKAEDEPAKEVVTPPEVVTPADWLAGLTPEVQEKVKALKEERDRLDHRVKSELGRVPALQRKVDELSRKLQDPRPATPAGDPQKATTPSKLQEKLAQIRLIDPLLADTLEDISSSVVQPLREDLEAKIKDTTDLVREEREEQLFNQENAKLIAAVPQAHEVFKLPAYRQWVDDQTEGVRTLAKSIFADDVILVLEKFAKEMQSQQRVETPAPVTTPPVVVEDPKTTKVVQERERKLAASAPPAVSGVAKAGDGIPDDADALFSYYSQKIRKGEM